MVPRAQALSAEVEPGAIGSVVPGRCSVGSGDGWITVNPRLDEGADVGSVGADNIGMPGKILITSECGGCWVGPAQ